MIIISQSSNTQASSNIKLTDSQNENQDNDDDISYTEEGSADEMKDDLQILLSDERNDLYFKVNQYSNKNERKNYKWKYPFTP